MRHQTPPSTSPELHPGAHEMPNSISSIPDDPTIGSSLFDWSDFLEFDLDDPFAAITFDPGQHQEEPTTRPEPEPELTRTDESGRKQKRDQRLVCPNFLAGRIPCACPELDEKLEQEEEMLRGAGAGKKRARSLRAPAGSTARCQVPDCEADISELKGYHRRHRVCLQCAHASTVVLGGQDKRYCQQCGKFHILSDFDEGKRSCRRKLERHNNRRRRKPADGKGSGERESQFTTMSEDANYEDDTGKDSMCLSSQIVDKEALLESEAQVSALCSAHDSDNIQGDSIVSFVGLSETQIDQGKENPKSNQSVTCDDHKSPFSSVCTTGRISFKLYDWNPAEFPRRLRHQIFQWLASMPVELEGYIRPGCTILTIFIAMPKFMWVKLFEEPACQLHDFVNSPGNLLHGRGTFFTYLNNMKFSIVEEKGGTSVVKLLVSDRVPKLHCVQPTCFEAGKPLEFVMCGSNLLQPKSRFLVSFAGKYLTHDFSVLPLCENTEDDGTISNHQLVKVSASQTDPNLFGPAFVEVENESGLSNFIPILIADKNICAEMKRIEQRFYAPLCSEGPGIIPSSSCQVSAVRQAKLLELMTEVAWSVKKPVLENTRPWTSTQMERTDKLLNFLIASESTATLDRVLHCLKTRFDNKWGAEVVDADRYHLQRSMHNARSFICQKLQQKGIVVAHFLHQNYLGSLPLVLPSTDQGVKVMKTQLSDQSPELNSTSVPLLNGEVVMRINVKERPEKSCGPLLTKTVFTCRPFILAITAATLCLGLCAVLLHPQKVGELAVTIRKCVRFRIPNDLHN